MRLVKVVQAEQKAAESGQDARASGQKKEKRAKGRVNGQDARTTILRSDECNFFK
jgi:hypothetical protein